MAIKNLLLISSYNTFTDKIIDKFAKEGWRIFTLVSEQTAIKPKKVFKQYCFRYDNNIVSDVFASCRPQVVIFAAAYDPLYNWEEINSQMYLRGLINIWVSAGSNDVKHIIYLSSECAFQGEFSQNITEGEPCNPGSPKGRKIVQGEKLAIALGEALTLETTIVRLANLYYIPKDKLECRDYITQLCLQTLQSGTVRINSADIKSGLFIGDAVEALYLLIRAERRNHQIYHVSSEEEIRELSIVERIGEFTQKVIPVDDYAIKSKNRVILSGNRFAQEFSFHTRTGYREAVPKIIQYMERNLHNFISVQEKESLFHRIWNHLREIFLHLLPFIECAGSLILVILLNSWAANSLYLQRIDFYLLYVLVFAAIRGRGMAIVAFVLALSGYFYEQMQLEGIFGLVIGGEIYIWIINLFLVALIVGHLRDSLIRLRADKEEEVSFLKGRIDEISSINSTNTKIKNYFQEKVINSQESIGWFYDVISRLDQAERGEVIFIATELISRIMGTKHVAIYTLTGKDYCRLMTSTTPKARSLGKSIFIPEHGDFFRSLREGEIFINSDLDVVYPSMASTLLDENGEVRFLFLLWELPYEHMTLYYSNLLKVLGALVYNALNREASYLELLADKYMVPGTQILSNEAFAQIVSIYRRSDNMKLVTHSMIELPMGELSLEEWDRKLRGLVRREDYIGLLSHGNLGILLTNTSLDEIAPVLERFKKRDIQIILQREWVHNDFSPRT